MSKTDFLIPKDKDERSRLIEHWLQEIEVSFDNKGIQSSFLEDLRDKFDRSADLSDGQISALGRMYRDNA